MKPSHPVEIIIPNNKTKLMPHQQSIFNLIAKLYNGNAKSKLLTINRKISRAAP